MIFTRQFPKIQFIIVFTLQGGFIQYLDPKQGEGRNKVEENCASEEKIEEFGNKWRYRCPFDACEKNAGKGRAIGYKVCVDSHF